MKRIIKGIKVYFVALLLGVIGSGICGGVYYICDKLCPPYYLVIVTEDGELFHLEHK